MPRERKPLIEPGSVLPDPQPGLLERIVARDRAASGRAEAPESFLQVDPKPQAETHPQADGNITSNITAHIPAHPESSVANREEEQQARRAAVRKSTHKDTQPEEKTVSKSAVHETAQAEARERAATRPIPITLRLPEGLNDWLDDYAHAHRKEGVKKQDLISRAVQLLILERATTDAGEEA